MASISYDSNGRPRIQFTSVDGSRKTLRPGKVSKSVAQTVKVHIERLNAAKMTGDVPPNATLQWLTSIGDTLHKRIAAVGLVEPRASALLGDFIDGFIAGRSDVKPSTRTTYYRAKRWLIEYFGADKPLRDITPGDADDFARWLKTQGLADNTVRKTCSIAKQFGTMAVRKRLIEANPFADLTGSVIANRERDYFISREETVCVLDACPDAQWRLMFALARYGGLRCPSEVLSLRWEDIDWQRDCFTVHASKTEHHDGKATRLVPIFPELMPYMRDVFDAADEGATYAITRYRKANTNLGPQLKRIIKRAGLTPWAKPWQNLRASRETELAEDYPEHVVCAWIGHSKVVAAKHYLQVTDEHFMRATSATQNPAQKAHETNGTVENAARVKSTKTPAKTGVFDEVPLASIPFGSNKVGDAGLEPATSRV